MTIAQLRAIWWKKQRLGRHALPRATAEETLRETGWARSVGGGGPYFTAFCRCGIQREAMDQELANQAIHELPAARGCAYVLSREHYQIGLLAGQGFSEEATIRMAKKKFGVTDEGLARLNEAVLKALAQEPLDSKGLREALGDLVISFGDAGKKVGLLSNIPLAIGKLQSLGKIRRIPVNGRLDNERYRYAIWNPSPLDGATLTKEEAYRALAELYFRWNGVAKVGDFQKFSAIGVGASKRASEGLASIGDDWLCLPDEIDELQNTSPDQDQDIAFVSSLDGLMLLRRDPSSLIEPEDRDLLDRIVPTLLRPGGLVDVQSHGIFDRGRLIGIWEFDPGQNELVWWLFPSIEISQIHRGAASAMTEYVVANLGDARSDSMDSPKSRAAKLQFLRENGQVCS